MSEAYCTTNRAQRFRALGAACLAAALSLSVGCGVTQCPKGTVKEGEFCKTSHAIMTGDADPSRPETTAGATSTPPSIAGSSSMLPTAAAGNTASAGSSAPVKAGAGGNAGQAVSNAGTNAAGAGGAAVAGNTANAAGTSSQSVDVCKGHAGENVCEGAVLQHCDAAGKSASPSTCTSAMYCQLGTASGKCAVCNPGSFHCDDAALQTCDDSGQYGSPQSCASAALCNEKAGACTDKVCTPNSKVCAASGMLQTCNAEGSQLTDTQPCGAGMCDAKNGRCYKCMPSAATCQGTSLVKCSADGQTETMTACSGATPACQNSKCVACTDSSQCKSATSCAPQVCNTATNTCMPGAPQPAKTPCENGGVCDSLGGCTLCGNGRIDLLENCETAGATASAAGTCDPATCMITNTAYAPCFDASKPAPVNASAGWFCAPTGAVSRVCSTSADCLTTGLKGACIAAAGASSSCAIRCASGCPAGLKCIAFGSAETLCGQYDWPPPAAQ